MVLAFVLGRPVLALASHSKVVQEMTEMGQGAFVCETDSADSATLLAAFDRLLAERAAVEARARAACLRQAGAARAGVRPALRAERARAGECEAHRRPRGRRGLRCAVGGLAPPRFPPEAVVQASLLEQPPDLLQACVAVPVELLVTEIVHR